MASGITDIHVCTRTHVHVQVNIFSTCTCIMNRSIQRKGNIDARQVLNLQLSLLKVHVDQRDE